MKIRVLGVRCEGFREDSKEVFMVPDRKNDNVNWGAVICRMNRGVLQPWVLYWTIDQWGANIWWERTSAR